MTKAADQHLEDIKMVWFNMVKARKEELEQAQLKARATQLSPKELNRLEIVEHELIILQAARYAIDPIGRWE